MLFPDYFGISFTLTPIQQLTLNLKIYQVTTQETNQQAKTTSARIDVWQVTKSPEFFKRCNPLPVTIFKTEN